MLGAQDRQRTQQSAQRPASQSQSGLHQIWMAESRATAEEAFDHFLTTYERSIRRPASACKRSRTLVDVLRLPCGALDALAHYESDRIDFCDRSAANQKDPRVCLAGGILAMVFKLTKSAEQRWRKLKGAAHLAQVIKGVRFKDGLQEEAQKSPPESSLYTTFAKNSSLVQVHTFRLQLEEFSTARRSLP